MKFDYFTRPAGQTLQEDQLAQSQFLLVITSEWTSRFGLIINYSPCYNYTLLSDAMTQSENTKKCSLCWWTNKVNYKVLHHSILLIFRKTNSQVTFWRLGQYLTLVHCNNSITLIMLVSKNLMMDLKWPVKWVNLYFTIVFDI